MAGSTSIRADLHVVLDGVRPAVAGLHVQVFDDPRAPQLVLENATGQALEILDDNRRAFVRIGPEGVQGDLAAAAWYDTVTPGGVPPPKPAPAADAAPQWQSVRRQNTWNWFDRRLDKRGLAVADAAIDGARPAALRRWSVPLKLGHRPLTIEGYLYHQPRPAGALRARLLNPELAPGLRVSLAPGEPPSLRLENHGEREVVVLGTHGEPFVRIRADGVDGNLASASWHDQARYQGRVEIPTDSEGPRWQPVSLAPRYSWIEPRAAAPSLGFTPLAQNQTRSKVKAWQVPILLDGQPGAIAGVVEWVPVTPTMGSQ